MYCVEDCVPRFLKTYNKICKSGLIEDCSNINVIMVGMSNYDLIKSELTNLSKLKIAECVSYNVGEIDTINAVHDYCINNPDSKVLYLHSKGASRGQNKNIIAWVNYMEYFLIEKYKTCIENLDNYDAVGVEYSPVPKKHYSGNFWWANSSYVNTLKSYKEGLKCSTIPDPRWYCEFWLLDTDKCNPRNLHCAGMDLYGKLYEESNYRY